MQGLITVKPLARIFEKVHGSAHDKTQTSHVTLKTVIDDAQNLFVIGFAGAEIVDFIEVYHLIHKNEQSAISGNLNKYA